MDTYFGLEYFINANKRIYFLYLISSALIAFLYLHFNKKEKRIIFTKKLWLHPSAKLDYIYFFISNFIKILLIYPIVISAKTVAFSTSIFLMDYFGYIRLHTSYELVIFYYTISIFIFSDFTRYLTHRLLHLIPFLWQFHKVHHSAKVLTPFTFYRVHPVENILFGFRYSLSIGFITGIFVYLFAGMIDIYSILGVNIFVFIFSLCASNLRHSHIKIRYPSFLEKVLISPYMHQIHHSTKYYNKNFGGYLAIWDYIFSSIQLSKDIKKIHFGLKNKDEFSSISKLLFQPFITILKKRFY